MKTLLIITALLATIPVLAQDAKTACDTSEYKTVGSVKLFIGSPKHENKCSDSAIALKCGEPFKYVEPALTTNQRLAIWYRESIKNKK